MKSREERGAKAKRTFVLYLLVKVHVLWDELFKQAVTEAVKIVSLEGQQVIHLLLVQVHGR